MQVDADGSHRTQAKVRSQVAVANVLGVADVGWRGLSDRLQASDLVGRKRKRAAVTVRFAGDIVAVLSPAAGHRKPILPANRSSELAGQGRRQHGDGVLRALV